MCYGSLVMATTKTGFDKWVGKKMKQPSFAASYRTARKQIDTVDQLVRTLDDMRQAAGVSKAELARAINAKPEIVRRLFTKEGVNPTLQTVIEIAGALGLALQLVPAAAKKTSGSAASRAKAARAVA